MWTCKNHQTGEVVTLHSIPMARRPSDGDLSVTHPDWVHRQCGTESERELQGMLDAIANTRTRNDYLLRGPDACGVGYTQD
jgi:hypothetical protein